MGSDSLVIDLGDDLVKTPLSSHRRKQATMPLDRSVSSVDFVDSLQDPPLTMVQSLGVMARDRSARPALLLVGERCCRRLSLRSPSFEQLCCWRLPAWSCC